MDIIQFVGMPIEWPEKPSKMSYSQLLKIEACPYGWALSRAKYPDLWDKVGYPERPGVKTIIGSIVHLGVEIIIKNLKQNNCYSINDPNAFQIMKKLGGYSKLIENCTEKIISNHNDNPRFQRIKEFVLNTIWSKSEDVRENIQSILGRLQLQPISTTREHEVRDGSHRQPLGYGSYPEVKLEAISIGWQGIADLINISEKEIEIVDYKTGGLSENHNFQLQVYSLLWSRDIILNPNFRLANKLTLSYPKKDVQVPVPTSKGLETIELELKDRTSDALNSIASGEPKAKPSQFRCPNCTIRHNCGYYWENLGEFKIESDEKNDVKFIDLEVTIIESRGPFSWNARVDFSNILKEGSNLLIIANNETIDFKPRDCVRILRSKLILDTVDPYQPPIVELNIFSEVFRFS